MPGRLAAEWGSRMSPVSFAMAGKWAVGAVGATCHLVIVTRRGDAAHAVVDQLDLGQRAEIEVLPHGGGTSVGEVCPHVGLAIGSRGSEADLRPLRRLVGRRP